MCNLKKKERIIMNMKVRSSTMVKPMVARPSTTLWLSNMDLILPTNYHTLVTMFYRSTGSVDFFKSSVLESSLSRVLVELYPMAGRLRKNINDDRTEINCNGEGALLVEAESDGFIDELGDFSAIAELLLSPEVDYSGGISSFPLLLVQVTRFKCGGVCLGFAINHLLADGFSCYHIAKTWSEVARGVDSSVVPCLDRRLLSANTPPTPLTEYAAKFLAPPTLESGTPEDNSETVISTFKITRDQLNALEDNIRGTERLHQTNTLPYTKYTVLAGHVWRCVTMARALPKDQETMLFIPLNGRSKMQPPLPRGYFGNAVFGAICTALCGELESNPLEFAARKIHDAIARVDYHYLRSIIDSLEYQMPDGGIDLTRCPNLTINNWASFSVHDMDFGWGKPIFLGHCGYIPEGYTIVLPSPTNDGSLSYAISLPQDQMHVFQHLLYNTISNSALSPIRSLL